LGEYGRPLGGVTQRHGNAVPHSSRGGNVKGNSKDGSGAVGDLGVQLLQNRLVVGTNRAPLYQTQDDEALRLDELPTGAILVPVIQATSGGTGWYMLKTPKGTIGWVKATDVLEQSVNSDGSKLDLLDNPRLFGLRRKSFGGRIIRDSCFR
jgi:hypothetical protein